LRFFDYSTLDNINLDNELLSLISEIKEHKGKHNFFVSSKDVPLEKLVAIAKIQSVESSNRIEGIVTTERRLADLIAEKTTPQSRDEEEIMGYRDVLDLVHNSYEHIALNANHILQLHANLYKYSYGQNSGKFKGIDNYIQEIDSDGNKRIRFETLSAFLTPQAVDDICREYNSALKLSQIEPLILVPIFILDFLCIHPFSDGNGRVSRLLTLLLLYQSGFYVGKYISIEKIIEKTKENYYASLYNSSVDWHENKNDATHFVKYMLKVILGAYREFENRVVETNGLNKAGQVKEVFENHLGTLTKRQIKQLIPNVSETTIERQLKNLLDSGYIKKIGVRKNAEYVRVT